MQSTKQLTVRVSKSENFRKAIILYATKPHTINRQLAGAEQVSIFKYPSTLKNDELDKIDEYIRMHPKGTVDSNYIPTLFDALHLKEELVEIDKTQLISEDNVSGSVIILNKLLPKNLKCHDNCAELVYIGAGRVSFLPLDRTSIVSKSFNLEIIAENGIVGNGELIATALRDENRSADCENRLLNWIERIFLPKIRKWIESSAGAKRNQTIESLALVNVREYNELYNQLKIKYGENMVKVSTAGFHDGKYPMNEK